MKKLLILTAGLALAGCVEPQNTAAQPGVPYALSKKEVSWVRRDGASAMKDPESARFGSIAAAKSENGVVIACGFVNGKNSFGGYTGEQPFMGVLTSSGYIVADIAGTENEYLAMITTCRKKGVAI